MNKKYTLIFAIAITTLILATIQTAEATTYTKSYTMGALGDANLTNDYLWFDNTDYMSIRNITITSLCPQVNCRFLKSTDSTTFTIISGGSGTGTFTYRNETDLGGYDPHDGNVYYRFTWTFTNTKLNANRIHISYSSRLLDNVVARYGGITGPAEVNANTPTIMVRHVGDTNYTMAGDYTVIVDDNPPPTITCTNSKTNNATTSFNINPQEEVLFSCSSPLNIKTWQWLLNGANQNQNYSSISLSFPAGTNNLTVDALNATNGTSDPWIWTVIAGAGNILVPGSGNSPSGQIYFDGGTLNIGNNYGINVSMTSSNFSSLNVYYIDTFEPGGKEIDGFPISFNSQTYSTGRLFSFNKVGLYYSNLSYCSYINFLCPSLLSPTLIDTATLNIAPVSYTYNVTTNKPNYIFNENITIIATNPSLSTVYLNAVGPIGGSPQILTEIAWNTPVAPNSVKVFNASISPAYVLGTYYINMLTTSAYNGLVARAAFNITMPTATSNTLSISWNELHPTLGRSDVVSYTSNYNISYVKIYNTDQFSRTSLVRTIEVPTNSSGNTSVTFSTPGLWYASIEDQNTSTKIVWSNTSVFSGNPTDSEVQRICTSTESYACWDKSQYQQGQSYIINYKVVVPSFITYYPTIQFIDPEGKLTKSIRLNYSIYNNTMSGQLSGSFSKSAKTGVWFVKIEKINQISGSDDGEIANSATEVIGKNTSVSTGVPASGAAASSQMSDNLKTFMSTAAFWGTLIFGMVIIYCAHNNIKGSQIGYIGFVLVNVEAAVGLWAPYTWYILIIAWIGAGIFFVLGSKATSTD